MVMKMNVKNKRAKNRLIVNIDVPIKATVEYSIFN